MDKISIVIPCYNIADSIERCINSVKGQSYENFEALFIDDGSTDNTKDVILENIQNDERMKYLYKENGGVSSARNLGIENATGEYICFIDSDDYVEKDFLKGLYDNLIENGSDISICYFNRVYEDKISVNEVKNGFYHLIRYPAPWNKICRTSLYRDNNIRFPNARLSEDLGSTSKLLMLSDKVSVVEKPLYNYIQNPTSSMHTYDDRIYEVYAITEDIESFAKSNNLFEKFFDELEYINIYHILIGTVYRASFRDDFNTDSLKEMKSYVESKYPNWPKNKGIKELPAFYRAYLEALSKEQFKLIRLLLRILNKRINVSENAL